MSGKRAFLDLLKQEGVTVMFGNPGTTELPLMDAFAVEHDIRYILGLQEAALMAMADGYAQASGNLAVLNLHVAPGLGNAMGMLYDAAKANAPVLVTAGQQDLEYVATEPVLTADLPTLARPFVKWAAEVQRAEDLPLYVHRAVKTALAPPTGPVFLSLPGDILKSDAEIDLLAPTRVATRVRGDADAVAKAAEMLAKAERPVIIAGDAVAQSRAHKELAALAEALAAPVYVEFIPSTASFPASHPLYRGAMTRTQAGVREVLDKHDLVFSVGGDLFTWSLPSPIDPWPQGLPLIHLDSDPWQIGKNYPAQAAILGDPKATLPDITAGVTARMSASAKSAAAARLKSLTEAIKQEREAFRAKARALAGKTPVAPLALLEAIGSMLPKDAVVIEEILSSAPGIRSLINSDDAQSFFGLRGGGIGWGLPAAIGVKIALPQRPVVALIGDGSAMYTIQALWTAARYRLPIVWVIFNNTSYRILKQRLVMLRGLAEQADTFVGMELNDPAIDFVGLAHSLGIDAHRAKTVHDATDLIGKALSSNTAMLIDVDMERGYKPL
ncbi:MAG TPA: thiamine pyrophosphate-dependent enzyme [Xanthobacteraceae bacterium]|jgi:benzoylformate decarboxylase|nr:thiamine pyrophosphate-dependent enzyme [Xanthobacteraceae bacterium]